MAAAGPEGEEVFRTLTDPGQASLASTPWLSLWGKDVGAGGVTMKLVLFYPLQLDWRDSMSAQEALMGCGLQSLCERIWGICIQGPAESKR